MALEANTIEGACSGEQAVKNCSVLQKPPAAHASLLENANALRCQVREQIRLSRSTFSPTLQNSMYSYLYLKAENEWGDLQLNYYMTHTYT